MYLFQIFSLNDEPQARMLARAVQLQLDTVGDYASAGCYYLAFLFVLFFALWIIFTISNQITEIKPIVKQINS